MPLNALPQRGLRINICLGMFSPISRNRDLFLFGPLCLARRRVIGSTMESSDEESSARESGCLGDFKC